MRIEQTEYHGVTIIGCGELWWLEASAGAQSEVSTVKPDSDSIREFAESL